MRLFKHIAEHAEWYRGQGVSSESIEGTNRVESPFASPTHGMATTESAKRDPASEEREAKLELWMQEVKAFIRNIDVNNL